jgi:hypothetical protein
MMHAEHALAPRARAVRGGAGPQPAAFEDDEQQGGAAGAATVLTLLAGGPGPADPEQGPSAPGGVLELPVDLAGADAPSCAPALLLGAPEPWPPLSLVLSSALRSAASKGCAPDVSQQYCMHGQPQGLACARMWDRIRGLPAQQHSNSETRRNLVKM